MSGNRKGSRQNLTLENVLSAAIKTPVVKIDRANFPAEGAPKILL